MNDSSAKWFISADVWLGLIDGDMSWFTDIWVASVRLLLNTDSVSR